MYWNLTKPYFRYETGKTYQVKIYNNAFNYLFNKKTHPAHQEKTVYSFADCDMILGEDDFRKYFYTIEEFREKQINEIL
jgi:hypothetical protein